jgi:hypothetical protein
MIPLGHIDPSPTPSPYSFSLDSNKPKRSHSSPPKLSSATPRPESTVSSVFEAIHHKLPPETFPFPLSMDRIIQYTSEGACRVVLFNTCPSPKGLLLNSIEPDGSYQGVSINHLSKSPTKFNPEKKRYHKEPLGEGASAQVFSATSLRISPANDFHDIDEVAVARIKRAHFKEAPFKLLERVPPSPYLLGRPRKIYQQTPSFPYTYSTKTSSPSSFYRYDESFKYVYIVMDLLKEKKDLFDLLSEETLTSKRFSLLLTGCKHASLGAAVLHDYGLVHGDIRFENMGIEGLFDYGALCEEGFKGPWKGAKFDVCPPELFLPYYHSLDTKARSQPTNDEFIRSFISFYGRECINDLYLTTIPCKKDASGEPLFLHTKTTDVFLLGRQITLYFGNKHPKNWRFTPSEQMIELQAFTSSMVNPNPLKRPSMEQCAAFFDTLLTSTLP